MESLFPASGTGKQSESSSKGWTEVNMWLVNFTSEATSKNKEAHVHTKMDIPMLVAELFRIDKNGK